MSIWASAWEKFGSTLKLEAVVLGSVLLATGVIMNDGSLWPIPGIQAMGIDGDGSWQGHDPQVCQNSWILKPLGYAVLLAAFQKEIGDTWDAGYKTGQQMRLWITPGESSEVKKA